MPWHLTDDRDLNDHVDEFVSWNLKNIFMVLGDREVSEFLSGRPVFAPYGPVELHVPCHLADERDLLDLLYSFDARNMHDALLDKKASSSQSLFRRLFWIYSTAST